MQGALPERTGRSAAIVCGTFGEPCNYKGIVNATMMRMPPPIKFSVMPFNYFLSKKLVTSK